MALRYNFFYFEAEFKKYLIAGNAEGSTVKNYLSDLHYFFAWLQRDKGLNELEYAELPHVFSHSSIRAYYTSLSTTSGSPNTTIRRIATLRKFFTFCIDQRWLPSNPAIDFMKQTKRDEREDIISSYRKELMKKNYTSSELDRHINVIKDLIIN